MRFQRDFSTNLRKEENHMADLKEFEHTSKPPGTIEFE